MTWQNWSLGMQEFFDFINQCWVGTTIGLAGLALALLFYLRSRISGIIAFQSHDVPMVGDSDAVFPAEVEVRYRGTPVPRLISSTVWIWNAGKKTLRGADIVAHDPLQLHFGGEVLNVRIKKVSREVVRITADTSGEMEETVSCGFEFLDPGDGGVLEVLHTGSDEAPECTGTIIGFPRGLRNWGRARGSSASSRRERRVNRIFATVMLILGLVLIVVGILGEQRAEQYIEDALPFLTEPPHLQLPSWVLVMLGLLLSSGSGVVVWILGIRSPSSLEVD